MAKHNATTLSLNIDNDLLERIDKYRFRRMFASRTEAIEFLLETGLKVNPEKPVDGGHKMTRSRAKDE